MLLRLRGRMESQSVVLYHHHTDRLQPRRIRYGVAQMDRAKDCDGGPRDLARCSMSASVFCNVVRSP